VEAFLSDLFNTTNANQKPEFILNENQCKALIDSFEISGLRKEIWLYGIKDSYVKKYDIFNLLDSSNINYKPCLKDLRIDQRDVWDTTIIEFHEDHDLFSHFNKEDSISFGLLERWPENSFRNLEVNQMGGFLYGLAKFASCDTIIQNYVESRFIIGRNGPGIMAYSFLNSNNDFTEPFLQRLIIVEIYYQIILSNYINK